MGKMPWQGHGHGRPVCNGKATIAVEHLWSAAGGSCLQLIALLGKSNSLCEGCWVQVYLDYPGRVKTRWWWGWLGYNKRKSHFLIIKIPYRRCNLTHRKRRRPRFRKAMDLTLKIASYQIIDTEYMTSVLYDLSCYIEIYNLAEKRKTSAMESMMK